MGNLPGMAYRCGYDSDWTMHFVSEGCYGLTGYHPEDLLGNAVISYDKIIHPDDREQTRRTVEIAIEKKEPFELTYRIQTAQSGKNGYGKKAAVFFRNKEKFFS